MTVLTRKELLYIMALVVETTVVEPTKAFPFRVSKVAAGYSKDEEIARLQGKLSILLEMAGE